MHRNLDWKRGTTALQRLRRHDKQKADAGGDGGHEKFFQIKLTTLLQGHLFLHGFIAGCKFLGGGKMTCSLYLSGCWLNGEAGAALFLGEVECFVCPCQSP